MCILLQFFFSVCIFFYVNSYEINLSNQKKDNHQIKFKNKIIGKQEKSALVRIDRGTFAWNLIEANQPNMLPYTRLQRVYKKFIKINRALQGEALSLTTRFIRESLLEERYSTFKIANLTLFKKKKNIFT